MTDDSSSFNGYLIGKTEDESSSIELREVEIDILPKDPRERLLTKGVQHSEDTSVDIYVPIDKVSDVNDLPSLIFYLWYQSIEIGGFWNIGSRLHRTIVEIGEKKYVKLIVRNPKGLGVIALRPHPR